MRKLLLTAPLIALTIALAAQSCPEVAARQCFPIGNTDFVVLFVDLPVIDNQPNCSNSPLSILYQDLVNSVTMTRENPCDPSDNGISYTALSNPSIVDICAGAGTDFTINLNGKICGYTTLGGLGLPIELSHFSARIIKEGILLEWTTSAEINNAGFEVQRSTDGLNWDKMIWIDGQGQSENLTKYEYLDKRPVLGAAYYRLRQVDYNGNESYSPIEAVNASEITKKNVHLYPNPVGNQITLEVSGTAATADALLKIVDATGRVRNSSLVDLTNFTTTLPTDDLPAGYYFLYITSAGQDIKVPFIKR